LNLATSAELTTLPGVGPKRAEAILALRTRLKGFRKLSDLLRVKGIGVKSLRKLEPKLVLDVPKEPD
jgi:competence protein ComEA